MSVRRPRSRRPSRNSPTRGSPWSSSRPSSKRSWRLSERIVVLKDHSKIGEILNGPDVTAQEIVDVIAAHGVEAAATTLEEELDAIEVAHVAPVAASDVQPETLEGETR